MTVSTFATGLRAMLMAGAVLCPAVAGAQAVDYQALQETIGEPVTIGGVEIAPGDQVIADRDAILVVAAADWPAVEAAARAIQEAEDEIRIALNQGQRLADLLDLP